MIIQRINGNLIGIYRDNWENEKIGLPDATRHRNLSIFSDITNCFVFILSGRVIIKGTYHF